MAYSLITSWIFLLTQGNICIQSLAGGDEGGNSCKFRQSIIVRQKDTSTDNDASHSCLFRSVRMNALLLFTGRTNK